MELKDDFQELSRKFNHILASHYDILTDKERELFHNTRAYILRKLGGEE